MANRSLIPKSDGGIGIAESGSVIDEVGIDPANLDIVTSIDDVDGLIVSVAGVPKFIALTDFIAAFFNNVLAGQKIYVDKATESYIVYEDDLIKHYRDDVNVGVDM